MVVSAPSVVNLRRFFAIFTILSSLGSGGFAYERLFRTGPELGEKCGADLDLFEGSLNRSVVWAVEVWESTAKGIGVLQGNSYQLGNFDECLSSALGFERQYCLVRLQFKSHSNPHNGSTGDIFLIEGDVIKKPRTEMFWAVCVPASCIESDLNKMLVDFPYFVDYFNSTHLDYTLTVSEKSCQTRESAANDNLSWGAISFMSLFIILFLIAAAASTIFHSHSESKNVYAKTIEAFSFSHNAKQLIAKDEESLRFTYGLRMISAFYIIMYHCVGVMQIGPVLNTKYYEIFHLNFPVLFISQLVAPFVDIFFTLGGFFAIYSLCKNKSQKGFIELISSRLVRIYPIYLFAIFYASTIQINSGSGPVWGYVKQETENCRANWWTNLLFINNYVRPEYACLPQTWYVACDFHFFIIAIVLSKLFNNPNREKLGLKLAGLLLILSILIPAFITYYMEMAPALFIGHEIANIPRFDKTLLNRYIPSHSRAGPAIIGMLTAYVFLKLKQSNPTKISKPKSTLIFAGAILLFFANTAFLCVAFDVHPPYEPWTSSIYGGVYRHITALCISAMILINAFGEVAGLFAFLGSVPVIFIGKLTFGAYVLSYLVQLRFYMDARQSANFDLIANMVTGISYTFLSFAFSFVGYLIVEAPSSGLYRVLLNRIKAKERGYQKDARE